MRQDINESSIKNRIPIGWFDQMMNEKNMNKSTRNRKKALKRQQANKMIRSNESASISYKWESFERKKKNRLFKAACVFFRLSSLLLYPFISFHRLNNQLNISVENNFRTDSSWEFAYTSSPSLNKYTKYKPILKGNRTNERTKWNEIGMKQQQQQRHRQIHNNKKLIHTEYEDEKSERTQLNTILTEI